MIPIFNFNRKYPKALKDLAREKERLANAEEDIARTMLDMMREDNDREEAGGSRPVVNVTPPNPKNKKPRK